MTFTGVMVGGFVGFCCQCFSNKIRKVPLSRQPWMHVGAAFVGMYFAHKLPQWELKLVKDINEVRASKGMPPMVGTHNWIKYQIPEADLPITKPRY